MAFLDPPSNLRGGVGHRRSCPSEVAMAAGEMSRQEYLGFLIDTLGNAATHSRAGAIHYVGVDWRRLGELLEASQQIYSEMLDVAVWVKSNACDDGYYRSQHELIGVFRAGEAPQPNNTRRRHGRSRSNVWRYAGVKGCRAGPTSSRQSLASSRSGWWQTRSRTAHGGKTSCSISFAV